MVATIPAGELPREVPANARVEGFVPHALRDAVTRARTLRPAAGAFAEAMKREGGAAMAADRFERLAAQHLVPRPQGT